MQNDPAEIIRMELARRNLSRQWLVDAAKISMSSLDKALAGNRPLSEKSLIRIGEVLGISLAEQLPALPLVADASLGAYSRQAVEPLEGLYLAIRHSFERPGYTLAWLIELEWDDECSALTHRHRDRPDGPVFKRGEVALPLQTRQIYLSSNTTGDQDLAILGYPASDGRLYGVLVTLASQGGRHQVPAASVMVLLPLPRKTSVKTDIGQVITGLIGPDSDHHAAFCELLNFIEADGHACIAGRSARAKISRFSFERE